MTDPDEVVTLALPAQSRYIRLARLVGAGLANDLGVDLDGLDDVRLAIGEACGLAAQLGAGRVELRFSVADDTLVVVGSGPASRGQPADDEQLQLVRQILEIACSEHQLTLDDRGLTFALSFAHGT